jgi:ATP-dependent DNA helicase RecG
MTLFLAIFDPFQRRAHDALLDVKKYNICLDRCLMNENDLRGLIATGEGYTLEFKESLPDDLGKHLCAFSNASGGKIILGVGDDGTPSGYAFTNADDARINSYARNLDPLVRIWVERVGPFVVIHVSEGENKPHSSSGKFYLRIGSTSQQLTRDQIREFFHKEGLVRFDEKPNTVFDLRRDFDKNLFKQYLSRAAITPLPNEKDTMRNLDLLDGPYMRNAGVLLFTSRVTRFFISATVLCVLYQGNDKVTILDRKEFNADLLSNIEGAFTYLCSKLNTNLIIKADRTNRLELPEEALREALVNAMAHRDYFSTAHVQVDIYLDRVDISNPGGLVSGLPRKDFGKRSMPRNPLLMDLLQRIDKVEWAGSGIRRIRDAMKDYGLKPKFDLSEGFFSVVFPRAVQTPQATPQVTPQVTPQASLTPLEQEILAQIKADAKISRQGLAKKLGIQPDTVKEYLEKLKEKGAIARVGKTSGGHWEVAK